MIIKAWGVLEHTPLVLSNVLSQLNVSHSVMACAGPNCQYRELHGTGGEQPAWPVVMQNINELNRVHDYVERDRIIAFVFDSKAAITNSNLTIWSPCIDMYTELQTLLLQEDKEPFKLELRELSALDYVKIASKPSVLSELQSAWCKVNPYSLRKKVQEVIVLYLCADLSKTTMRRTLEFTIHGKLIEDLLAKDGQTLKSAVSMARLKSVDEAATHYDIDPFDINYLLSSRKKYK